MVRGRAADDHRDMTQTPHDAAGHGGQGPRVPPAQMRDLRRLRRSTTDRRLAGVAGGIARHLDVDPTIIRVLLVVLVFFGGAGLLLYGAVWLFVPEDGADDAPVSTSGGTRTVVLVAALVLAGLLLMGDGWWLGFDAGWPPPLVPVLAVALVTWLLVRNRGRDATPPGAPPPGAPPPGPPPPGTSETTPPPWAPQQVPAPAGAPQYPPAPAPGTERRPRARSLFGITMAGGLLALGVVAVVETAGTPLPWAAYPAAVLAVVGVALVAGAFVGRSTGLPFAGLLAAGVLAVAVWSPELRIGDVREHPLTAAGLQDRYVYTAGRVHLDLRDLADLSALDGRVLTLSMRAGEVVVDLPPGLDVDVVSEAQGGRLAVLGNVSEGRAITNNRSTPDTPAPDLRINLDLGFGNARVSQP
jgi:phage shock protein PspC (stress-responsive transcriptional regulator)